MEFLRLGVKCTHALPFRVAAIYYCCPKKVDLIASPWEQVVDFLTFIVGRIIRVRARIVRGSHQECVYQAFCLGIPPTAVPIYENGAFKDPKTIERWLDQRQGKSIAELQFEAAKDACERAEKNGDHDAAEVFRNRIRELTDSQ